MHGYHSLVLVGCTLSTACEVVGTGAALGGVGPLAGVLELHPNRAGSAMTPSAR
jgi:hypothetical protein